MKGKLIGVGVGPGDPDLLTIKATKTLANADIIALPQTKSSNVALDIAKEYIEDKELLYIDTPMVKNQPKDGEVYQNAAKKIIECLDRGLDVAFITLGDPTIYSTYIYIHKLVQKASYDVSIVPGITSFSAAAALLNDSLCEAGESLHIIPASYDGLEKQLDVPGNKVLMKSGKQLPHVIEALKERDLLKGTTIVEKCSMPEEKVYHNEEEFNQANSYFSVLIVKEGDVK
ncbi:MAG: precorrin-2 C(20)-methyltransferase [Erysipelotrichales bacterium]